MGTPNVQIEEQINPRWLADNLPRPIAANGDTSRRTGTGERHTGGRRTSRIFSTRRATRRKARLPRNPPSAFRSSVCLVGVVPARPAV